PVGIKDIIDTADLPTENGCRAHQGRQPTADAACVTALRRAGAVIMGKTVTTELATFTPGKTHDPRNPEHTPGGSSSGSAAAVGELVEELGGQVAEISLDQTTERGYAAARQVQRVEMAVQFGPLLDRAPELLSENLRQQLEDGRRVSGVEYIAALTARADFYQTVEEVLLTYGTILTPAAFGPAP